MGMDRYAILLTFNSKCDPGVLKQSAVFIESEVPFFFWDAMCLSHVRSCVIHKPKLLACVQYGIALSPHGAP